jgi:dihydrofolate synthase/folylpolyglutamate synthase
LGGRLDAVNLLDADAALVTQIGLDHQDWLGSDRDQIGREKAGIFRPARPAVIADRQPPRGLLFACAEIAPALWRFDQQDYGYAVEGDAWRWQGPHGVSPPLPRPALDGLHQFDNAAGAIALVQRLHARASVEWPAVQRALRRLQLPGRMQWQGRFLLDVAHNAEAAQAVAALLRTRQPDAKALWIAGLFADKPLEAIAAALAPVVERAITCDLPSSRALAAPELAARLSAAGLPAEAAGAPSRALHRALQQARPDQTILVCGSFLTVAAVAPLIADARTDD